MRQAFVAQRRLMKIVPQTREPGPKIWTDLLGFPPLPPPAPRSGCADPRGSATEETLADIKKQAEANAGGEFAIHLLGVHEGMRALAWVALGTQWSETRTPAQRVARAGADGEGRAADGGGGCRYVDECIAAMQTEYFDGIAVEAPQHVAWATAFAATLGELRDYIEEWHPTKMAWGAKARSMTFWSNAIAQTAPGDGASDQYEYSTKLGMPITRAT